MTIVSEGQRKKKEKADENLRFFKCANPVKSDKMSSNTTPALSPSSANSIKGPYSNNNSIQASGGKEKDLNYKFYKCFTRSWRKLVLFGLPAILSPLIYSAPDESWILVN